MINPYRKNKCVSNLNQAHDALNKGGLTLTNMHLSFAIYWLRNIYGVS